MTDPRFIGAFPRADVSLDPPLPEIAFLGRSNVGKSSLLNALVGRRLARVSATPGKTRALNVYEIPLPAPWGAEPGGEPPAAPRAVYFLDLPGYGYARASKTDRAGFARLVRHALGRERLSGLVWLLDIRRDPSVDDQAMQDRIAAAATPVLAALTKSDKLTAGQRAERLRVLTEALALEDDQVVVTSARTGLGIPDLREAIAAFARRA